MYNLLVLCIEMLHIDEHVVSEIKHLVPKLQAQHMFRGVGGDLMKEACCFLIMKCCLGNFPVDDDVLGMCRLPTI